MVALFIAAAWGLGLLLYYLTFPGKLFVAALIFFLLIWGYRSLAKEAVLLLTAFVIGCSWAWIDDQRVASQLESMIKIESEETVSVLALGKVDSFPVVDGDRLRFFYITDQIDIDHNVVKIKERLWVSLRLLSAEEKEYAHKIMRGDWLKLPLIISKPTPPTNPGEFDFPNYLWQQYTLYQANGEGIEMQSLQKPASTLGWRGITDVRHFLEERLDHIFTKEIAGLMKGMLLGDQKEVSTEIEDIYRNTGIIHILAISGTHVMLVIGALVILFRSLRFTKERTYEILLIFLPFYMILTGLSPSVVRSSLMGMMYLLARHIRLNYSSWQAISFVFILLTLIQPRIIFAVGFQLSFAVTLGLILFTKPLGQRIKERFIWMSEKFSSAIALTIVAQLFAFPILVTTFHQFPLASIPVNLLLMPIYAFIIPWGYLSLIIAAIWPALGEIIALPLNGLLYVIHLTLDQIVQFPQFILSIGSLPFWWWIIYSLIIILCMTPIPWIKRQWKMRLTLLFLILLALPLVAKELDTNIRVTFIDVGQGDSILIQGPHNQSILIDGGGEGFSFVREDWQKKRDPYDVGKNVVLPALRSLGVTQLNWLVLTHGDGDHIGGLVEVVNGFPVKKVLMNGKDATTELELVLQSILEEKKIPMYTAVAGPWFKWKDDVTWFILNPSDKHALEVSSDNDASVVLLLSAYDRIYNTKW